MEFSKELVRELKAKAVQSHCYRTGKASWTVNWYGRNFVVTSKGFRAPNVDIYDATIKKTRKELLVCIECFFSESTLLDMKYN